MSRTGKFDRCFHGLLDLEGWGDAVDHPLDAGRKTKYGISALAYPEEDIDNLDIGRAAFLYRRDYWEPLRLDEIEDEKICFQLFESAVHLDPPRRPRRAVKIAQGALRIHGVRVDFDGVIGPQTVVALNAYPHKESLLKWMNVLQGMVLLVGSAGEDDLIKLVKHRLQQMETFGRGWGRRIEL